MRQTRRRHFESNPELDDLRFEDYSHLFPGLPAFLPDDALLRNLGGHTGPMVDHDFGNQGQAAVRAAGMTFLGQFITHDISFDKLSSVSKPQSPEELRNFRTPALELDCLYGAGPEESPELYDKRDKWLLAVGRNDAGKYNDLIRDEDGNAIIGDVRNDENMITAQLHLAFVKFHNAVVAHLREAGSPPGKALFDEAQRIVRWHYQWIVLHDFLPQIVDKKVIEDVLANDRKFYLPGDHVRVPVEFSGAVFRFGHSIVKPHYVMNDVFGGGVLHQLLGRKPVKEKEVVQWHNFFWLDPAKTVQLGRRIDTKIAAPFFHLPEHLIPGVPVRSLPLLTLLKGKLFGMPSGQAVAQRMGYTPYTQQQLGLEGTGLTESPLWYYILKEADLENRGERLGSVGGRIAAEVLIGLLQKDPNSFLTSTPDWKPVLPSAIPGHFSIEDLLRFAGVADNKEDQATGRDIKKRRKRQKKYLKKFKHVKVHNPLTHGRWDILHYDSQIEAVHMSLLPTKKVLYYSGFRVAEAVETETRIWNPKDGDIKKPVTFGDIFCGGHCQTSTGNLLSTGGTMEYRNLPPLGPRLVRLVRPLAPILAKLFGSNPRFVIRFAGPTYLYLFDKDKEEWQFVGDMIGGRWYPTNTLLPNGKVLILSGTDEAGGFGNSEVYAAINRRIEVYDEETGLEHVGDIPDFGAEAHHHAQGGDAHQHEHGAEGHMHDSGVPFVAIAEGPEEAGFPTVYPRMFVLPLKPGEEVKYPRGKAFCAGYGPETKMLNLKTWQWEHVGNIKHQRQDGCAALLPLKPPHYDARIVHFGGSTTGGLEGVAMGTAEMIDFSEDEPEWRDMPPPLGRRLNGVFTILPNGKILAYSGNATGKFDDANHKAELYDPEMNAWSYAAEQRIARGYHCTGVLLADGRVLASGTTPLGKYELGMEVYYPDYCFKGPRPVILSTPEEVRHNAEFDVQYEWSWDIRKAVFIAPGSMTHAFDMNQRMIELEFEILEDKVLRIRAPRDAHVAPPGYYMLFILSGHDVPSKGEFIRIAF